MLALLLVALSLQGPGTVDPESLLATGRLSEARRVAERLVARNPRDARARLQLGRVWNAWPVIGRYRALEQFRAAERLAPDDLEPLRGQVEVGYRLGSDEGEAMARAALLKLLALRPDDPDGWARFTELYHSDDIRRRAERVLATHPDDLTALERRALIALALEEPGRADSLAELVLARRGPHVPAWLVRAEAAFQLEGDSPGYAWYDSALAYAALDSAGALWDNVRLIATPDESARFDAAGPGDRRRFFQWFWGKRDPNLLTRESERIAEHFRRLAYVRRRFQLLHPLSLYHRSASARTLSAAGVRPALLPPDTPGARSIYSHAGLDARGLVWLRHGPPDVRLAKAHDAARPLALPGVSPLDAEAWLYESADGPASVAFTRATASAGLQLGGDYVFTPITRRQAQDTRRLLTTDRTTLPAPLAVRAWTAFFRGRTPGRTDIYCRTAPETAGLALWDEGGVAAALTGGAGLLRVSVPPGRYTLGMDVDSAGVPGRIRSAMDVPHFARAAVPTVSSLVLAAADSSADREATLAGMPADLVFRSGAPLAAYAEIYGLAADAHGARRYVARYTFAPVQSRLARTLGGRHEVVFEFTREAPAQDLAVEQLVLEARRVPPGRYRVTLGVTDAVRNVKAESVAVEITVR